MTTTRKTENEAQREVIDDLLKEIDQLKEHNKYLFEYVQKMEKDLDQARQFGKFYRRQINLIYEKGLENVKL